MKRYIIHTNIFGMIDADLKESLHGETGYWLDIYDSQLNLFLTEDEVENQCKKLTKKEAFRLILKGEY